MAYSVTFLPDNKEYRINSDKETILDGAARTGIVLQGMCGGAGTCGRCRVILKGGSVRLDNGEIVFAGSTAAQNVLACSAYPIEDVVIEVPETSRLKEHQIKVSDDSSWADDTSLTLDSLAPLFHWIPLKVPEATLDDFEGDWERCRRQLVKERGRAVRIELEALRKLPVVLRQGDWQISCGVFGNENVPVVIDFAPGVNPPLSCGLAVDVGTTSIVAQLVDLKTGCVLGTAGTFNRQAAYGYDVISRIVYAAEVPGGTRRLHEAAVDTINNLITGLINRAGVAYEDIKVTVCAGNPAMTHLLAGVDPSHIRIEPYITAANSWPALDAKDLGLRMYPAGKVVLLPGVAGYVGGDIVAGAVVAGLNRSEQVKLLIDIGTNGEMIMGNNEWMVACACSAGPAFEGGGIGCGMRAMSGAIEKVEIHDGGEHVRYQTIDCKPPVGVCGSGLINGLAALHRAGLIDRSGRLVRHAAPSRMRRSTAGLEFVLAFAGETGHGKDIVISQSDIDNLIRAKAAIFAGIQTMLNLTGLNLEDIDRVMVAGGFGRYLGLEDAVAIGMLPPLPRERYEFIGNTALKGARHALLSRVIRKEMDTLARQVTYLDLSSGNEFMEAFTAGLFIPHTDLSLFSSIGK
ncbi:MAG: DUF4445 domain-containing protein [Peptococcaceae bacterium]|nr:DUF4445 domain-containing protein [Peptococcaceae bacterium]